MIGRWHRQHVELADEAHRRETDGSLENVRRSFRIWGRGGSAKSCGAGAVRRPNRSRRLVRPVTNSDADVNIH